MILNGGEAYHVVVVEAEGGLRIFRRRRRGYVINWTGIVRGEERLIRQPAVGVGYIYRVIERGAGAGWLAGRVSKREGLD